LRKLKSRDLDYLTDNPGQDISLAMSPFQLEEIECRGFPSQIISLKSLQAKGNESRLRVERLE